MGNLISREDIKKIIIEAVEYRFSDDIRNTILKSKSSDGEDLYIYKDLGLDSLDVIELLLEIEYNINNMLNQYNIKVVIDDNFIDNELTVRSLIDYIYKKING